MVEVKKSPDRTALEREIAGRGSRLVVAGDVDHGCGDGIFGDANDVEAPAAEIIGPLGFDGATRVIAASVVAGL